MVRTPATGVGRRTSPCLSYRASCSIRASSPDLAPFSRAALLDHLQQGAARQS